jgi:hypothetical protein
MENNTRKLMVLEASHGLGTLRVPNELQGKTSYTRLPVPNALKSKIFNRFLGPTIPLKM